MFLPHVKLSLKMRKNKVVLIEKAATGKMRNSWHQANNAKLIS